jgi:hypothetical protein
LGFYFLYFRAAGVMPGGAFVLVGQGGPAWLRNRLNLQLV